jgi:predicted nucleotidyltransferase
MMSANFLDEIKNTVKSVEPEAEVILFGSRARGDFRQDSDWDLLILSSNVVDSLAEDNFRNALFDLQIDYEASISTFVYSKEYWKKYNNYLPLFKNVLSEGKRL